MAENLERQIWLDARKHLSEYEVRQSELQLDLQQEQKALQLAKDDLTRIKKETASLQANRLQYEKIAREEHMRIMALMRQRSQEAGDTQRLAHQINLAKHKLEQVKTKAAKDRSTRQAHFDEQQAHLAKLQAHFTTLQPASAFSFECTQQCMTQPSSELMTAAIDGLSPILGVVTPEGMATAENQGLNTNMIGSGSAGQQQVAGGQPGFSLAAGDGSSEAGMEEALVSFAAR